MKTDAEAAKAAFARLLGIMDDLREKCPWDRKQTFESLRPQTVEECSELSDAILDGDMKEISKELGDVLLHVVFYAKLGEDQIVLWVSTRFRRDATTDSRLGCLDCLRRVNSLP